MSSHKRINTTQNERSPKPVKSPSPDFLTKSVIISTKSPNTFDINERIAIKTPNKNRGSILEQIEQLRKQNQQLKSILQKSGKNDGQKISRLLQQIRKLETELYKKDQNIKNLKQSQKNGSHKRISLTYTENSQIKQLNQQKKEFANQNKKLIQALERNLRQFQQMKRQHELKFNQLESQNSILKKIINQSATNNTPLKIIINKDEKQENLQLEKKKYQLEQANSKFQILYDQLYKRLIEAQTRVSILQKNLNYALSRNVKRQETTNIKSRLLDVSPLDGMIQQSTQYETPPKLIYQSKIQEMKIENLQKQLSNIKLHKNNLEEEIASLRSENFSLQRQLNAQSNEIKKYSNQNNYLKNQIQKQKKPVESAIKGSHVQYIKRLQNQREQMQFYLGNCNIDLEKQKQARLMSQNEIQRYKNVVDNLKLRLSQNYNQKIENNREYNILNLKYEQLQKSNNDLLNQYKKIKRQKQTQIVNFPVSEVATITNLSNQLTKTRTNSQNLKRQIHQLAIKYNQLEKQNAEYKRKEISRSSFKDIHKKPSQKKIVNLSEVSLSQDQIANLQKENEDLKKQIRHLENQLGQNKNYLEKQINILKTTIFNLEIDNGILKRQKQMIWKAPSTIVEGSRYEADIHQSNMDLELKIKEIKQSKNIVDKQNSILTSTITNLEKQIQQLKNNLTNLENQKQKLKNQSVLTYSQILPNEPQLQSFYKSPSDQSLDNADKVKEYQKIAQQNQELSRKNFQLQKIKDALYSELSTLRNKVSQQDNIVVSLEHTRISLETQIKDLKNILKNNSEEHIIRQIEQLSNRNKELEKVIAEKSNEIKKQREKQFLNQIENRNIKQSYEIQKQELFQMKLLKEEISKIKAENTDLESKINQLKKIQQTYVKNHYQSSNEIKKFKQQIDKLLTEIDNYKRNLKSAETEILLLTNQKATLQELAQQQKNKENLLQQQIDRLNNQVNNYKDFKPQIDRLNNQVNQYKDLLSKKLVEKEKAEHQINSLKQILSNINLNQLRQLIKQLKQGQRILLEEKIELLKSLNEKSTTIDTVLKRNDLLNKEVLKIQSQYIQLKRQSQMNLILIQSLKQELKILQSKNQNLSSSIQKYLAQNAQSNNFEKRNVQSDVTIKLIESRLLTNREEQMIQINKISVIQSKVNNVIQKINKISRQIGITFNQQSQLYSSFKY